MRRHSPKDTRYTKSECTNCETAIPDWSTTCPSCETKFPTCVVTGQPLFDYQFWMCTVCKHRAYEKDITQKATCPLCHTRI
ncbi:hypothetical protein LSAT2_004250 [Lamellibrachia satsuma]|nr:hypothetical protein LSAT2_004250 [Lamellibrachia satsuma]